VARLRGRAAMYLSKQNVAVLTVSSDLRSVGPMGRSVWKSDGPHPSGRPHHVHQQLGNSASKQEHRQSV
jgi:hypothetical protein